MDEKIAMERAFYRHAGLVCLISIVCILGCGGPKETLGPVSGKVTFNGEPVTEGMVMFSNPEKAIYMIAKLDEQGHYEVMRKDGPGLPPGDYTVTVRPPTVELKLEDTTNPAAASNQKQYTNIPMKYRYDQYSGLKITVTEEGVVFDIPMKP